MAEVSVEWTSLPLVDVAGRDENTPEKDGVVERRLNRMSVKAYVETLKPFSITFQDLSVYVPREKGCCPRVSSCCPCLLKPLSNYAMEKLGWAVAQKSPYYALKETSGFVSSGEMVLVLTPDTQYASALIQTLTGRLSDKYSVTGSIRVNGAPIPTNVMQGWRRIAAHVSADDSTHSPVLTVRETLRFAAECTHPADFPAEKIDDVVNEVMEVLDLTSAADTVVGDENLRGISGGQRRRVTVGEMLVAKGTRFLGLENITDGLSSQDSFNIIKELKSFCASFQAAAVVSLNQPSDEIVELFDNLLVLNHAGELTYFGPLDDTEALKKVFMPSSSNNADNSEAVATTDGMSICDICLNPMMDEDEATAIHQRYLDSPECEGLAKTIRGYHDPRTSYSVAIEDLLPKTKYASGIGHSFKVLGKRRALLIFRNPSTYMRIFMAVFFGIIVGSLFSVLDQDLSSSLARTAYMFQMQFLVLLLSTGVTVPQNIRDRITYFKHRSAEFYSSKVFYVCQVLFEIPLSIVEAILICVTSYFWVDMNPEPSRFFFFLAVMMFMELVGLALGRLFCSVSRNQVSARSVVSVATLLFSTVSGFMPKYNQIPPIFRWLSWISPPAYGFEALAINQYVGQELAFATLSNGDGLDTEVGSLTGEDWLNSLQLPRKPWGDLETIKIVDLVMLFLLAVVIDILGLALMERGRKNFFSQLRRPQRFSKSLSFVSDKGKGGVPEPLNWPSSLTISDLCYFVKLKGEAAPKRCSCDAICGPLLVGKKKGKADVVKTKEASELQLLTSVSATFGAGRATALMGTSGAGKTTLLDVIAGYKTGGRITGDLTLSGIPKDKQIWQLISGYAEQSDILNPYLTIMETLKFTASCRLPASMNRATVIDSVVHLMSLEDWVDFVIGDEKEGEGIPKHVRKRVTIAVQLVMLPKILFLDEPTTGLGTSAANLVMRAIRRSTTELNLITVATIHQPSKLIWDAFDDLLLLSKGGKVAYMGEIGPKSEKVLKYFSQLSTKSIPENSNPADFVISAVSGVSPEEAEASFLKSKERQELVAKLAKETNLDEQEKQAALDSMKKTKADVGKHKSAFRELGILTKRQLITQWRNPAYAITRIFCSTLLAVYFGILFSADKSTIEGAVLTIGSTFFLVFVLVQPQAAAIVPLVADRAVLYREATSGLYSRWTYAVSSLLADIPFHILNALLMFLGFYFIVGFQLTGDRPAYFIVMIFFCNWAFTSIGQVYAITTPNEEAASGLAGLTTILSVIFMGFLISYDKMPYYWKWANTACFLRYVIQGLTSNELGDNYYKLFPDGPPDNAVGPATSNMTLFGDLGNATNLYLFNGQTDMDDSSGAASQASNLLNLVVGRRQSRNESRLLLERDWNNTFIGDLENFIQCGMENECFADPVATNFMKCFVLDGLFRDAPCKDEFNAAVGSLAEGGKEVVDCLRNDDDDGFDSGNATRALVETEEEFDSLSSAIQDNTVLCLIDLVLPDGELEAIIKKVESIIKTVSDIGVVVVDIAEALENGLPGEVILFVFGWADFEDGELVAPYKWWYCLFAVSMFIVGVELFKLFGTVFIVWTNR